MNRSAVLPLVVLLVALLAGCSPAWTPGSAVPAGGSTAISTPTAPSTTPKEPGPASPEEPCTEITHADPSTVFESSLADGDTLEVGRTGWIQGSDADDVTVSGSPSSVRLEGKSTATQSGCGKVFSRTSWIEVRAVKPGRARLTTGGKTIAITITARP